jgi:acyl-[acyl carrier protein]--UDP-N-acetylglucosamine O-acyltransferase
MASIHPTSLVAPNAKLGTGVEIGPFSIVHNNVVIGARTRIGAYCEMGVPTSLGDGSALVIGDDSLIRSHSVFYESSCLGSGLTTGHRVTVRECTVAGNGFQIGTLSEIQGHCQIGHYVRFQSNVFVGGQTKIRDFVWVLPYAVLTNDPTPPSNHLIGCEIQDYAVISAMAVVLPGVVVGERSLIAAHACVTKNVPKYMVVAGVPANIIGDSRSIMRRDASGMPAYPWTTHFHRGYPTEILEMWQADAESGEH